MSSDFDRYQRSYESEIERSISFIGKSHDFFMQAKADALVELAAAHFGDPRRVSFLDVGCGNGLTDELIAARVGSVSGVDLSARLIEEASNRNPGVAYRFYDGGALPYEEATFDIVFAICVLHHVPPPDWAAFVAELKRVTRPGGLAVLIEHNPRNPLTRLAVARCEFDETAVLLSRRRAADLLGSAGLRIVDRRYILFFPWSGRGLRRLEGSLGALPLGAQYIVAGERPPAQP